MNRVHLQEDAEVGASPLRYYNHSGPVDVVPITIGDVELHLPRLLAERVMNELKRALSRYPD